MGDWVVSKRPPRTASRMPNILVVVSAEPGMGAEERRKRESVGEGKRRAREPNARRAVARRGVRLVAMVMSYGLLWWMML